MEPNDTIEKEAERTYADYAADVRLNFDPLQDLNLPASYEEVRTRYKRLRTDRSMETLN
ncbi:MAG: hypothetical protein JST38_08910 [Bacteroidetes bacterium]|nr:hypothetical protein [Bacteroidota bacterium]